MSENYKKNRKVKEKTLSKEKVKEMIGKNKKS
jgi:hypothetical protein